MAYDHSAETDPAAQDTPLSVITTSSGGISVLTLVGEIDDHSAGPLRQALEVTELDCPRIVADLRQVTFIDSTGINIFLAAHLATARAGGWLRLAHLEENVSRVFSLVGVDTVIDCRHTLSDALTD
ncbi:STAS domain-containing protein [Streptomyces bauhiniae]|uniref:Anti-sigma factor antagonist n=1 Tax=Streptomyces bauhiniae TaxID=2340725 RepID=A0A7K3QWR5_9ACTN|nr:STAS domain-containing protein [Streptomyces bauhiniae]NEB94357.1 STAS domain-containing protein [Streptomyces bauhiniae]